MLHIRNIADHEEIKQVVDVANNPFSPGRRHIRVTQAMIDNFAEITDDEQWIHVDPLRAEVESLFGRTAESPNGKTIAHGDLVFALRNRVLPLSDVIQVDNTKHVMHRNGEYFFRAPVCAGHTVRGFWQMPKHPAARKNMLIADFNYRICILEEDDKIALEGSIRVAFFV